MSTTDFLNSLGGKTQAEAKEMILNFYSDMSPERFSEHMSNMREMARQSGQNSEREEIVCRLLASGMDADEIAVVLCIRADAVRIIEHNYAAHKIPNYAKKLKERRRYRERQSK